MIIPRLIQIVPAAGLTMTRLYWFGIYLRDEDVAITMIKGRDDL